LLLPSYLTRSRGHIRIDNLGQPVEFGIVIGQGAFPWPSTFDFSIWVMGCLRDDVGGTSGVPQIAADLLHRPSWQSRANSGRHLD
jgi:hypothetical protein